MTKKHFTSLILLAGGSGLRMGGGIPKQFRPLKGTPVALHSFALFSAAAEIDELIVVCAPAYRPLFASAKPVRFAEPGPLRQDSVYNGLLATDPQSELLCIHDAARPFLTPDDFRAVHTAARESGAAALAHPAPNTIKQADPTGRVEKTLRRSALWEMQTPQIIRRSLLLRGYDRLKIEPLEVTDDLSLVEALGEPAILVKGSPQNFKLTTPFDWRVAESLCATS